MGNQESQPPISNKIENNRKYPPRRIINKQLPIRSYPKPPHQFPLQYHRLYLIY